MRAQWQGRWADYYEVLGISFGASRDEVRKAYKTKSWLFHPDVHRSKQPGVQDEAAREFARVQEAYECLHDEADRREYDGAWLVRNLLQHVWIEPSEIDLGEYQEGNGQEARASFSIRSDIRIAPQDLVLRFVPSAPLTEDMILEIDLVSEHPDVLFPLRVEMAISTATFPPGDIRTDLQIEFDSGHGMDGTT